MVTLTDQEEEVNETEICHFLDELYGRNFDAEDREYNKKQNTVPFWKGIKESETDNRCYSPVHSDGDFYHESTTSSDCSAASQQVSPESPQKSISKAGLQNDSITNTEASHKKSILKNRARVSPSSRNLEESPTAPDPHIERRKKILQKYPQISSLKNVEPRTKYYVLFSVLLQVYLGLLSRKLSGIYFYIAVYFIGATINHSLFLAIHEISHNLAFTSIFWNRVLGIFANIPIGIPFSVVFGRYHTFHHHYMGRPLDTDIPTSWECYLVSDSATCYLDHCLRKAVYLSMYTVVYAVRPLILHPKIALKLDFMLCLNIVTQIAFDMLIYHVFGMKPLIYFLGSTFLAGSLHPLGGRFLSEHLVVVQGSETYSYYGSENNICYNVGLHNEHHDFPRLCFTELPKLREIAPEFYGNLPATKSWMQTQMQFIFDDNLGPSCRVKRV